jgi:chemotaxis protein MotB
MADAGHNAIIIKKVKKSGHGHHGGAWKVAYADFVTAMMAFFLLLWLLGVTTDDQKRGLADYFAPTTASLSRSSGSGDVLSGRTLSVSGSRVGEGGVPAVVVTLTPPPPASEVKEDESPDELEAVREQERFDEALEAIKQALNDSEELSDLTRNLIMDMTSEGMRIQIIDQEEGSLFQSGSANMQDRTRMLLGQIAQVISRLPNEVAITGHTDATPFGSGDYTNWELSTDRALSSRRALVAEGVEEKRIVRVVGRADQEPLIEEDPFLPENRRISIVLLRGASVLPPEYNE